MSMKLQYDVMQRRRYSLVPCMDAKHAYHVLVGRVCEGVSAWENNIQAEHSRTLGGLDDTLSST